MYMLVVLLVQCFSGLALTHQHIFVHTYHLNWYTIHPQSYYTYFIMQYLP